MWEKIRKFWHEVVYDPASDKVSSKRFMSIMAFFSALALIFGNHYFNFELDYVALGSLLTMAGFNAYLGQKEKKNEPLAKDF